MTFRQQQENEEYRMHEESKEKSFNAEVWDKLSCIDVSKHIEKKMNLSYLSWAWAWSTLMNNYPDSSYIFDDPSILDDGSCEIWVTVNVRGKDKSLEGCVRRMWLPVMNHKNQSIKNPDSRAISDTRMRCLTKCLAMFGLGHYIYAGEDIPQESKEVAEGLKKVADAIIKAVADNDPEYVKECWVELDKDEQSRIWTAKTKGGDFTQKEKDFIRASLSSVGK